MIDRRSFLRRSTVAGVALGLGPSFWRAAYAAPAQPGPGPYGPLQPSNVDGMLLPRGFTGRVVAVSGEPVAGYTWHTFPDGAATFPTEDGGWAYAVNSEVPAAGGVGAIRFDADGEPVEAYRILSGTSQNCAGGPTPWGTWLSCEEFDFSDGAPGAAGRVWECDPFTGGQGIVRPAMGAFSHEAVAVDPDGRRLYLTEDQPDGRLYRFTPDAYPDLSAGLLEVAVVAEGGATTWAEVPDPSATTGGPTRLQVPESTAFDGGEGIWFDVGYVYFTCKGSNRVWVHDIAGERTTVLYDAGELDDPPLTGVDNVVVAPSGDVLVGEDGGNLEVVLIAADTRDVTPIMRLEGPEHEGSEITGPCFSPDGTRLYFSSQRGGAPGSGAPGQGVTYEVSGPFRRQRVGIAALGASGAPEPVPSAPAPAPTTDPSPAPDPTSSPTPAPAADAGADLPATGGGLGAVAIGGLIRARSRGHDGEDRAG